jgi:inosine triphosphate pyrophosphatase
MIYFITGNQKKFVEAKNILSDFCNLKYLNLDLPEIQEIDSRKIITAKFSVAANCEEVKNLKDEKIGFILEDVSLCFDCLNGLPGPLVKWFLLTIGNKGLFNLVDKLENNRAEAKVVFGYTKNFTDIYFFEGSVSGKIISSKQGTEFGWDAIFCPDGSCNTFAEMTLTEKNSISHRRKALDKLKGFLRNSK